MSAEELPTPTAEAVAEARTITPAEELRLVTPPQFVTRGQNGKERKTRGHGTDPAAMLLGATVTLGLSLVPRLARSIFRGGKKAAEAPKTPDQKGSSSPVLAFGSPVNPLMTPHLKQAPLADLEKSPLPDKDGVSLPPGQIKIQLQMLQDMEKENAKLKSFVESYMKDSEKVKALEKENEALKLLKGRLESDLNEVTTKFNAVANNGEELSRFKLSMKVPMEARSVYSDVDAGKRDSNRVDTSVSVAGGYASKKNSGVMPSIMKWASANIRSTASPALSQSTTPRGTPQESPDVVGLFDMFGAGGRH